MTLNKKSCFELGAPYLSYKICKYYALSFYLCLKVISLQKSFIFESPKQICLPVSLLVINLRSSGIKIGKKLVKNNNIFQVEDPNS